MTATERLVEGGITNQISTSFWRCERCYRMYSPAAPNIYYVEDSVKIGDSWESIIFRHSYSNPLNCTGWCIGCAKRLLPPNNIFQKFFRRFL